MEEKVKKMSNICVHIKTYKNEYGPVEDCHLIKSYFSSLVSKKIKMKLVILAGVLEQEWPSIPKIIPSQWLKLKSCQ